MQKFDYSNSQALQDLFVICVLNGKRNGTYLEVGANQPIHENNTFLLESKFGWSGVSFEMIPDLVREFNRVRRNVCIRCDATVVDFTNIIRTSGLGPHIDYLQLDIEPPANTFKALKEIDFQYFSFSVITYEHDLYAGGHTEREESREILSRNGYTRVVSDVSYGDLLFEDWYINQRFMPNENWRQFIMEKVSMNRDAIKSSVKEKFDNVLRDIAF